MVRSIARGLGTVDPARAAIYEANAAVYVGKLGELDRWIVAELAPVPAGRDTFILDVEGTVLGIAIVRRKFLFGDYLELLGIAPSATGRGFGSSLLSHIESLTFARATNLFACVSDFNDAARGFYRKQGYKEIGPMPNFLIPGYAEILLRKTAGPARKN